MGNRTTTAAGGRQAAESRMQAPVENVERKGDIGANESRVVELANGEKGLFKPSDGEQTDQRSFVSGSLARREVAAYGVDDALGWGLVPTTVYRDVRGRDGSMQRWVAGKDGADALLQRVRARTGTLGDRKNYILKPGAEKMVNRNDLLRLKALDHIIGNQDRRFYNLIVTRNGRVRAIDNSLSLARGKNTVWTSGMIGPHMKALGMSSSAKLSSSDVASIKGIFGSGSKVTNADIARVRGIMGNPPGGRFGIGDGNIRGAIQRARDIVTSNGTVSSMKSPESFDRIQV